MSHGRYTAAQQRNIAQMQNDPAYLDQLTRSQYGMGSAELEHSLRCLIDITQNRMPTGKSLEWAYQSAKDTFGWSRQRADAEIRECLKPGSPDGRIHRWLTAGGRQITPEIMRTASDLVQNAARADLETSVQERLENSESVNAARKEFEGMPASERALQDSKQRDSLRDALKLQMTGQVGPKTYQQRVQDVMRSRMQLADRLDASSMRHAASGTEPSLRESVASSYDVEKVRNASMEIGLPDVAEDARVAMQQDEHWADDNYDVTAELDRD